MRAGNHKVALHLITRPVRQPVRRVLRRELGRNNATRFRNHADRTHPTRSRSPTPASTGNCASRVRTRGSNTSNADGAAGRENFGGPPAAKAGRSVPRATPTLFATARSDNPERCFARADRQRYSSTSTRKPTVTEAAEYLTLR